MASRVQVNSRGALSAARTALASTISASIADVGEKRLSAGVRAAAASPRRLLDWRSSASARAARRLKLRDPCWRETIRDGLENAPQALIDLLHGENFGKMLVKVD